MGIISSIKKAFGPSTKASADFVNPITVELHSHLLPGIDDGCQTMEDTLAIIRKLKELNYRKIITTPHVMGDYYKNTPEIILGKLDEVREALTKDGIDIELDAAAEYNIDEWFPEKIKNKELLTFGKNYVLVETPFINEPRNLKEVFFDLKVAGYQPVFAHPERYLYYHEHLEKYDELHEIDILFQVNLMSLTGYYAPQVQKVAEYLLKNNMIDFAGSDIHSMRHMHVVMDVLKSRNYEKTTTLALRNNEL